MRVAILIAALLFSGTLSGARKKKAATPQSFDYYLLTLSWAPDFCAQTNSKNPAECGPGRKVGLSRKLTGVPEAGKPEWQPDEGSDASGVSPERINDLLGAVSGLTAARFAQYDGKIPAETGLEPPLVTIEIHTVDRDVTHRLRLGKPAGENQRYATTASGDSGPVAVIAEAPWATWATKPPPSGKGDVPAEAIEKPKASP